MTKKILITSTDLMMVQFLLPHVINLVNHGYCVDIACSDVGGRINDIHSKLDGYINRFHQVRLHRNPLNFDNFNGFSDMKRILSNNVYDVIWTNEPVMGVVTRLAAKSARRKGTKLIYMVHGFHFFNGAPFFNWLVYYPIEKVMASYADVICTVNKEDYNRALKFPVKEVDYIHGIGINTSRLSSSNNQTDIRKELGISSNAFIVLSIGELNRNKNQEVIINALNKIHNENIHYVLCGKGNQFDRLNTLIHKYNLTQRVHLLGYRNDVVDICSQSNVFVMPSKREGLPVASLEAMYCGLPVIGSNIRGLVDVVDDGINGFICPHSDCDAFANRIMKIYEDNVLAEKISSANKKKVKPFCINNTMIEIETLLNKVLAL